MDEKRLKKVAGEFSLMLEDFEYFIKETFLPWLEKFGSLTRDSMKESEDLRKYVEGETLAMVKRQKEEIFKLFEEVERERGE